jgi:diguanylate cyclase (GGDEF)-like protein
VRKSIYTLIVAVVTIIIAYVLWLVRELRSSIMETEQKANTDVLTGLQNRNRYEMFLNKLGGSCKGLACIYIDANGLHELNNSKGHFAGDQMLRFIADTLKVQFSGENIFRIGGDEFVVFQSGKKADEVNKALSNFVEALSRNDYHAAVGTSFFEEGMSADELIGSAEKKMYEAKKQYYESIGKTMRV